MRTGAREWSHQGGQVGLSYIKPETTISHSQDRLCYFLEGIKVLCSRPGGEQEGIYDLLPSVHSQYWPLGLSFTLAF